MGNTIRCMFLVAFLILFIVECSSYTVPQGNGDELEIGDVCLCTCDGRLIEIEGFKTPKRSTELTNTLMGMGKTWDLMNKGKRW